MADPALFEFDGVVVAGHDRHRLDHVTGRLPSGGITVVAGPSGAGKSTLLRCCNRLDAPSAGTVRFRGDDIAGLDPRVHRRRVGMVFQGPVAFPGTVLDNLRVADPTIGADAAGALLGRAHLDPALAGRDAGTLSGGEAQRMVLARCLATSPEVLLMDEPTSALDSHATRRLEELATELAGAGLSLVWVTHDLDQLRRLADHVVVVAGGRWAWDGPAGAGGIPHGAPPEVAAFFDEERR